MHPETVTKALETAKNPMPITYNGEQFYAPMDKLSILIFGKLPYDLEENFKLASKVYKDRQALVGDGFTAWSTYQNKKYLAYMK